MPGMSTAEIRRFLVEHFPQGVGEVESAGGGTARLRLPVSEQHLRPGGTVSGPALMALADCALYVAILAEIGPVALAVTTNFNINFFRKAPPDRAVIAEARLFKLGKRLAVGEITLRSDGATEPVAHVTATYSIPPPASDSSFSQRS